MKKEFSSPQPRERTEQQTNAERRAETMYETLAVKIRAAEKFLEIIDELYQNHKQENAKKIFKEKMDTCFDTFLCACGNDDNLVRKVYEWKERMVTNLVEIETKIGDKRKLIAAIDSALNIKKYPHRRIAEEEMLKVTYDPLAVTIVVTRETMNRIAEVLPRSKEVGGLYLAPYPIILMREDFEKEDVAKRHERGHVIIDTSPHRQRRFAEHIRRMDSIFYGAWMDMVMDDKYKETLLRVLRDIRKEIKSGINSIHNEFLAELNNKRDESCVLTKELHWSTAELNVTQDIPDTLQKIQDQLSIIFAIQGWTQEEKEEIRDMWDMIARIKIKNTLYNKFLQGKTIVMECMARAKDMLPDNPERARRLIAAAAFVLLPSQYHHMPRVLQYLTQREIKHV